MLTDEQRVKLELLEEEAHKVGVSIFTIPRLEEAHDARWDARTIGGLYRSGVRKD